MCDMGVCIQAHSALESPQLVVTGPNSWKWLVTKVLSSRLHLQEAGKDISLHMFVAMAKVKNTLSYTSYLIPKARHNRKCKEIKGINLARRAALVSCTHLLQKHSLSLITEQRLQGIQQFHMSFKSSPLWGRRGRATSAKYRRLITCISMACNIPKVRVPRHQIQIKLKVIKIIFLK